MKILLIDISKRLLMRANELLYFLIRWKMIEQRHYIGKKIVHEASVQYHLSCLLTYDFISLPVRGT